MQEQHTPDGTFHLNGGVWMPVVADKPEPVVEAEPEAALSVNEPAKPTLLNTIKAEEETLAADLHKLLS